MQTILKIKRLYRGVSFVWLMGADNLETFDLWKNWEVTMAQVPIGIINRPGKNYFTRKNLMTEKYKTFQLPNSYSKLLAVKKPPVWCSITVPLNHKSSTQIRSDEYRNSLRD